MAEVMEKKYSGYGYHGGGRKPTGRKKIFVSTSVSGSKEEIEHLKKLAEKKGKTVSRLVLDWAMEQSV